MKAYHKLLILCNSLKYSLDLLFFLLLFSCSIPTEFFIQNLTSSKHIIKINYKKKISNYLINDDYRRLSFNYENGILKPGYFNRNKNDLKSLKKTVINDTIIMIEVPANSTTRIEKTHNYSWHWTIKSVEIDNQEYSMEELGKKAEKKRNNYMYKIE